MKQGQMIGGEGRGGGEEGAQAGQVGSEMEGGTHTAGRGGQGGRSQSSAGSKGPRVQGGVG